MLPRLAGPIQLDGLSDEPAWETVEPWLPTQYEPDNGAPPTERTLPFTDTRTILVKYTYTFHL